MIVWLFIRNWRTVLISSIAIPTSVITTFTLIRAMDFTLNSMTLLGLTLAVGIVIDDAIIVLENIYRYIEDKGVAPMQAAILATLEHDHDLESSAADAQQSADTGGDAGGNASPAAAPAPAAAPPAPAAPSGLQPPQLPANPQGTPPE